MSRVVYPHSFFNLMNQDDWTTLNNSRQDFVCVSRVVMNGAGCTPALLGAAVARFPNLEEVHIQNFKVTDAPPGTPLPQLPRRSIPGPPPSPSPAVNALFLLRNVLSVTISSRLDPHFHVEDDHVVRGLLDFAMAAYHFDASAATHIVIGEGVIDVLATPVGERRRKRMPQYRRTVHLYDPKLTPPASAARIQNLALESIAYGLQCQMYEESDCPDEYSPVHPLNSSIKLRIPLSLVPCLQRMHTGDAPYFVALQELEIDWNVDVKTVARNVGQYKLPTAVDDPRLIRVHQAIRGPVVLSADLLLLILRLNQRSVKDRASVELWNVQMRTEGDFLQVQTACASLAMVSDEQ
ncbi:hypothetical protein EXIGLDRAFT_769019 [Exidia glandulosa HHB12029]|uniref:Uncharacterized protein n=1 Tax=Exidia glandulosa HHB12029 TaxID=1314781 RepID=A0A165HU77_EXIGL|nr:hypothetical protein EXIGLDRAFT_769019 [Exidia glandulosa HHB12029]